MRLVQLLAPVVGAVLAGGLLVGCSAEPTVQAVPKQPTAFDVMDQEQAFWTAYQKRLGMEGDYADPNAARRASVDFGHTICDSLRSGMDHDVAVSQLVGSLATPAEAKVKVDTATEFLCPDQSKP